MRVDTFKSERQETAKELGAQEKAVLNEYRLALEAESPKAARILEANPDLKEELDSIRRIVNA